MGPREALRSHPWPSETQTSLRQRPLSHPLQSWVPKGLQRQGWGQHAGKGCSGLIPPPPAPVHLSLALHASPPTVPVIALRSSWDLSRAAGLGCLQTQHPVHPDPGSGLTSEDGLGCPTWSSHTPALSCPQKGTMWSADPTRPEARTQGTGPHTAAPVSRLAVAGLATWVLHEMALCLPASLHAATQRSAAVAPAAAPVGSRHHLVGVCGWPTPLPEPKSRGLQPPGDGHTGLRTQAEHGNWAPSGPPNPGTEPRLSRLLNPHHRVLLPHSRASQLLITGHHRLPLLQHQVPRICGGQATRGHSKL